LEAGNLRLREVAVKRITTVKFTVVDGGGNGASYTVESIPGKDGYNELAVFTYYN